LNEQIQHLELLKMIEKSRLKFLGSGFGDRCCPVAKKMSPETLRLFPDDIKIKHLELLKMLLKKVVTVTVLPP